MRVFAHLLIAANLSCLSFAAAGEPSEQLLDAIRQVESGGRVVYGDGGRAYGPYQIHACVIEDVNRRYGTTFTLSDRASDEKSRQICRLYLRMYGRGRTQIEMARIWNGGPNGYKKKSTIKYAKKIERAMKWKT